MTARPSLLERLRAAGRALTPHGRQGTTAPDMAAPKLLEAFADAVADPFFVEIGSNDGEQHDHLRPFIRSRHWSGVMVEPVDYVFARLRENYEGFPRVALEQAAIGPVEGVLPFYYLRDASQAERSALPAWYDGVGSFRREVVLGHAKNIPDVEERLRVTEVPTLTFDGLCRRHGVERVDLLVIDAEGFDWELIRHIDLPRWSPTLLIFEHFHLSSGDRQACLQHLRKLGYQTMEEGFDTFCLGPGSGDALRRAWTRLRPGVPGVSVEDEVS